MARKKRKPRSFFEPWVATKSPTWNIPYRIGPPTFKDGTPEEQRQTVLDWEAKKDKAEKSADWIVWGSKMSQPTICTSLEGQISVANDQGIIAVSRSLSLPEGSPSQAEIATRIAECVTAMAGIADPEAFITDARALMQSYARGECVDDPRKDTRVLSLLCRCVPIEELQGYDECTFDG